MPERFEEELRTQSAGVFLTSFSQSSSEDSYVRNSFLEFLVKARMRHEEELCTQSAGVVRTSFSGLMLLHVRAGFPTTSVPVFD